MNASDDKKESKKALKEPEKQNQNKSGLIYWHCKEKYQLMDCHKFKMKPVKDRIVFAACISKAHFKQP